MVRRYFPVTVMAGRLFPHGTAGAGRFSYWDEAVVEGLLKVSSPGDRKIHNADELTAALDESTRRRPAMTLWVVEGMESNIEGAARSEE